jgi:hypothetical protein
LSSETYFFLILKGHHLAFCIKRFAATRAQISVVDPKLFFPDPALGLIPDSDPAPDSAPDSDSNPDPACLTKVIRLYKIKL